MIIDNSPSYSNNVSKTLKVAKNFTERQSKDRTSSRKNDIEKSFF